MKLVMRCLLGIVFIAVGVKHFVDPNFFVRIMPPYLPWHLECVYISGVFEVALGVLVMIPRYTRAAAWGLIALLIAVFPANLHMALNTDQFPDFPAAGLWARLPLQAVLIAWAYWFTKPTTEPSAGAVPQL
jgi:uncharacterized membrane protein